MYNGNLIDSLMALVDRVLQRPAACEYCGEPTATTYRNDPVCEDCYSVCREIDSLSWAEYRGEVN